MDSFVWIIKAPIGKNDIDNKVYFKDNEDENDEAIV